MRKKNIFPVPFRIRKSNYFHWYYNVDVFLNVTENRFVVSSKQEKAFG